ncbi:hypothetical protein HK098_003817 [Nowakowskiella sp. JEL0407]|nr:hypothetical protein HK098_003817 [Nowakowskiella sp. JEL0407]
MDGVPQQQTASNNHVSYVPQQASQWLIPRKPVDSVYEVFQCINCRAILSDSTAHVIKRDDTNMLVVSGIVGNSVIIYEDLVSIYPDGPFKGRHYYSIYCVCQNIVGKLFLEAPHQYALDRSAIKCYRLGVLSHGRMKRYHNEIENHAKDDRPDLKRQHTEITLPPIPFNSHGQLMKATDQRLEAINSDQQHLSELSLQSYSQINPGNGSLQNDSLLSEEFQRLNAQQEQSQRIELVMSTSNEQMLMQNARYQTPIMTTLADLNVGEVLETPTQHGKGESEETASEGSSPVSASRNGESPRLYRCPKAPFCSKVYKNPGGLKYHLQSGTHEIETEGAADKIRDFGQTRMEGNGNENGPGGMVAVAESETIKMMSLEEISSKQEKKVNGVPTNSESGHSAAGSLASPPMTYHDVICTHLYNIGFVSGIYSDFTLRIQPTNSNSSNYIPEGTAFKLHRIIVSRSPYLSSLLSDAEMRGDGSFRYAVPLDLTIPVGDPNLTAEGLSIALGHLYASFSLNTLTQVTSPTPGHRSAFLRSVLAAANLLHLVDLAQLATNLIKSDISRNTVIDYCLFANQPEWGGNYAQFSQEIRDAVFGYLCRGVVRELSDKIGPVWSSREGESYKELVKLFAELPFEWLKKVAESKAFEVPSDMERYYFSKEIIQLRASTKNSQSPLVAGEENVLISFGAHKTGASGVTILRKATKTQQGNGMQSTNSNYSGFGGPERKVWKAQH